jgi:hypothetical protein
MGVNGAGGSSRKRTKQGKGEGIIDTDKGLNPLTVGWYSLTSPISICPGLLFTFVSIVDVLSVVINKYSESE